MIETSTRRTAPRAALTGATLALLGAGLLLMPSRNLPLSYAALFGIILGFALAVPLGVVALMAGLQRVMGAVAGTLGRMAARSVTRNLSRTGIAAAALCVAVSATLGVGIMIDSFRRTFDQWLHNTLRADIYVTVPSTSSGPGAATLDQGLVRRLGGVAGVDDMSTGRWVRIESSQGVTKLFVLQTTQEKFRGFQFKQGDAGDAWPKFHNRDAVIVSEPYAYWHNLGIGDAVHLRTDRGERRFVIAGINYDYGSDRGVVTMGRRTYERYWDDRTITSLGIYAALGVETGGLLKRLRQAVGEQQVIIRSNRAIRTASLEIFDRTFTITAVLRLLATAVAFIGVLSALMAMQLERAREVAVLRVNGLTPMQVWRLATYETGLIGLASGLLAIPLGIIMSLALILVINRRSFGWTMQVAIDPVILLQATALALSAALLAGLYPAFKMASRAPALALHEE